MTKKLKPWQGRLYDYEQALLERMRDHFGYIFFAMLGVNHYEAFIAMGERPGGISSRTAERIRKRMSKMSLQYVEEIVKGISHFPKPSHIPLVLD